MQQRCDYDVLIIGGGINGAAIARDAAGRGLRVLLCEQDDLGAHTSSASSKLIHGGLRYLEQYELRLVRTALREREILLGSAPHIMRPLRFVLPQAPGARPAWLIRAGLFLYDRLARRAFLPGSTSIRLRSHVAGAALQAHYTRAFVYSDGWVDDARLVLLNALDAHERGARILTHTRCVALARQPSHWVVTLAEGGAHRQYSARCVVNAAGPWAARLLQQLGVVQAAPLLRLIKGSHIVVPRLFSHPHAYIFQHPDRRIVFALPYEGAFTLIGTTDIAFEGEPGTVAISAAETDYLCTLVNRYFAQQIGPADVLWSYAGVRALAADDGTSASAATREFQLAGDTAAAPLLSVLGGKITTSRTLAEQAVNWIGRALGCPQQAWTAHACLPGGDLYGPQPGSRGVLGFDAWQQTQAQRYAWLAPALLARYARAYGSRIGVLLADCRSMDDLGEQVLPGLYAVEIDYLMTVEWARCAADILWRRSKLGLHLDQHRDQHRDQRPGQPPGQPLVPASAARLDAWIAMRHVQPA